MDYAIIAQYCNWLILAILIAAALHFLRKPFIEMVVAWRDHLRGKR